MPESRIDPTHAPFRAVDHVAVIVSDMGSAIAEYQNDLGLTVVSDDSLAEPPVRLVHLDGGNVDIQLVQPLGPGRVADDLAKRGPGLHHICFGVGSLTETLRAIGEDSEGIFAAVRGRAACFLRRAPENLLVEVIEFNDSETPGSLASASDLIRSYWVDESARDMASMLRHFNADAEVEGPGLSLMGLAEIEAFYRSSFDAFPGLRVSVTRQFGGRGSHAFEFQAVLTDTEGDEWAVNGVNVVEVRDGKIQFMRSFEDEPSRMVASQPSLTRDGPLNVQ